jgi:hypothetical protein
MRKLGIWGAARIAGLILALPGLAAAREATPLTDAQLDNVTAGSFASGSGTAAAQGMLTSSEASVVTALGPGTDNATATGLVTSSASSPSSGPPATASSTLSLRVLVP